MREKSKLEEISQGLIILYIIYFCFNYFFGCNESEPTMLEKNTIYPHLNTEFQEGFDYRFLQKTIYNGKNGLGDNPIADSITKRHSDSLTTLGFELLLKQSSNSLNYKVKKLKNFSGGEKFNISNSTLQRFTNELNESYKDSLKKIAADK